MLDIYNKDQAKQHYPGQNDSLVRYHAEFFAAGMTAIIRRWLTNGCKEASEEMAEVVTTEYSGKSI